METTSVKQTQKLTFRELLSNWNEAFSMIRLSEGKVMDPISKWLIITRAAVVSMTYTSGLIGGLLAAAANEPDLNWWYFALAVIGITIAHLANNMINDLFDFTGGIDDANYPRAQYALHPILSGLLTKRELEFAILTLNSIDILIGLYLTFVRGPLVLIFAALGLFISVFYVAPPIVLKRRGLGELGVFIVWGPLMIGGTYFVASGNLPNWVWLAGLPYALIVTSVLIGKHIDKYEVDRAKGIRTLPVILGVGNSLRLNQVMMISFYLIVGILIALSILPLWTALTLIALPRLITALKIYSNPHSKSEDPRFQDSPLWYVGWSFFFNKLAGYMFVLGLIINLFVPLYTRNLLG